MDKFTTPLWGELPDVPLAALAPRVIFAGYWEWAQMVRMGIWEAGYLTLHLLLHGSIRYRAWDTCGRALSGTASAGELLIFYPGRHQYEILPETPAAMYIIGIQPASGALSHGIPVLPVVGRLPHKTCVQDELPRLVASAARIVRALAAASPGWPLETACGALELLHGAFTAGSISPPPSPDPWEMLLSRLDAGAALPSVRELAESMGYSLNHFTRLFRQRTGITPKRYLLTRQLAQARKLLSAGSTIQEAAQRSGFEDPLYFSRLFKQFFGVPPSRIADLPASPVTVAGAHPLNCHLLPPGGVIPARRIGQGEPLG